MIQESDRNLVMDNVKTRFQLILSVANHNVTKNLTGKLILCKKNAPKLPFLVYTNLGCLTLEGPGRQTVDTRSTSGLPLKTWGYDGSN